MALTEAEAFLLASISNLLDEKLGEIHQKFSDISVSLESLVTTASLVAAEDKVFAISTSSASSTTPSTPSAPSGFPSFAPSLDASLAISNTTTEHPAAAHARCSMLGLEGGVCVLVPEITSSAPSLPSPTSMLAHGVVRPPSVRPIVSVRTTAFQQQQPSPQSPVQGSS